MEGWKARGWRGGGVEGGGGSKGVARRGWRVGHGLKICSNLFRDCCGV